MTDESIPIDVMVYYLTGTIHTSFLTYKESHRFFVDRSLKVLKLSKDKPFGHSNFPYELAYGPKSWIPNAKVNLVHYKAHEYGGHFAALDNPKALAEDVAEFANAHWPGF